MQGDNRPALARARQTKIALQRQLPNLRLRGLYINGRRRLGLRGFTEHSSRTFKQLIAPLFSLVRLLVFAGQTPAGTR